LASLLQAQCDFSGLIPLCQTDFTDIDDGAAVNLQNSDASSRGSKSRRLLRISDS
jgi:hypothetical protein